MHQTHCTDSKLGGVTLDTARRKLHILAVERRLNIYGRDAVACHLGGVQPYTHRVTLLTPNLHGTNVADGLQLLLDCEVGNLANLQQRALVALHGQHKDRLRVSVGLRYGRRVAVTRQETLRTRHLVTHVICRSLQVHRELKLYGDTARTLRADTRQRTDTGDTVDVLLQRLGNLVFDNVGIGTRVGAVYRDYGVIDAGVLSHTERRVANHTKDDDD